MFKKYTTIENTYQKRYIERIITSVPYDKYDWQVFEKIDGANFCFVYDGLKMQYAKRNSILTNNDNFFHYRDVAKKYTQPIINFYDKVSQDTALEGICMYVYGELYGGYYPGLAAGKNKPINKNVYYSPEIDFIAFDVYLGFPGIEKEGKWMTYNEYSLDLRNEGVPVVELLFSGSLEDALNYPHEFITRIPAKKGLRNLQDNLAEGIVIKPLVSLHFQDGSRILLKKKITKFNEKQAPKNISLCHFATSPIIEYITENRLHNVISKIGQVTFKDFSMVMKEYSNDILIDYQKEHENCIDKKELEIAKKVISKHATIVVRDYLLKQM